LVASLLLSKWMRRQTVGQTHVGLLLPASVGGSLANVATSIAGKVPVNLNFTAGREAMQLAIERCELKTIVTARAFLAKAGIERDILPADGVVFIEDVLKQMAMAEKVRTLAAAAVLPAWLLNLWWGRRS